MIVTCEQQWCNRFTGTGCRIVNFAGVDNLIVAITSGDKDSPIEEKSGAVVLARYGQGTAARPLVCSIIVNFNRAGGHAPVIGSGHVSTDDDKPAIGEHRYGMPLARSSHRCGGFPGRGRR